MRTSSVRAALLGFLLIGTGCVRPHIVAPSAPQVPITLAVATWNMHAGKGDLVRFVEDLASGRLTGIAPTDYVVMLQEDVERDNEPLGAVAAKRHLFAFFLPLRRDDGAISGNAMLSTQPFEQPRIIPLPRQRQPRASAAANITVAGERLFIATVHLENRLAWWKVLFSDTARGRQARALLQELPASQHGVLGGDFNTWFGPVEPAWREMVRRFPETRFDTLKPTFQDRLVLDHLLFDLPDGWTVTQRVVQDRYGSDHHPVVAALTAGPIRRASVVGGPAPPYVGRVPGRD